MPHKTLIGVYLVSIIFDKKINQMMLAAILFLKLKNNKLHFTLPYPITYVHQILGHCGLI